MPPPYPVATIVFLMRPLTFLLLLALCAGLASSQTALPLDSVVTEGSSIPQPVILEIGGLHIASPINKAGIDQACAKIHDSGLFSTVTYRCAVGPKKGYALTLTVADRTPLSSAMIDVPGVDESEAWQWLSAKFHRFDRQVPREEEGQRYLAGELERHLAGSLRGQHLTVRMETDFATGVSSFSFQPEVLPAIRSVSFTGNQAVASAELAAALKGTVANGDYLARRFTSAVELNLRPVYEQHGFYRVKFAPGDPQWADGGVSVAVGIAEGEPYQLGKVELIGEDLPVDAMLAAAKFPAGKLANWKQIQQGLWDAEKVVKRTGFFAASAAPDRSYDDAGRVLNLRVRILKGPLYHFGELRITGLSPNLEERTRRTWRPKTGDPYDYAYPQEFFQAFSRIVDFRSFSKFNAVAQKGSGDHVMDINLVFVAR